MALRRTDLPAWGYIHQVSEGTSDICGDCKYTCLLLSIENGE